MARKYRSLYERLVANTKLAIPDDPNSCWLWTGHMSCRYPKVTVRVDGKPKSFWAHRVMLQEYLDVLFPFDEAAHTCYEPRCINPRHLEVQTRAHNLAERRGCAAPDKGKSWIPVLFPRSQWLDDLLESEGVAYTAGEPCPF